MKKAFFALALGLITAASASAASVSYTFDDSDSDNTFDVFVEVTGGSNGLATYNVALSGLDASSLDPATFSWSENILSNLGVDFVTRGFTGGLLEGAVGTDGYSAANTQFQQTPFFGVGIVPVFQDGFDPAPNGQDVDLAVPALLGTLTLPGAEALTNAEIEALLTPNAALFTGSDAGVVETPEAVTATVLRPEEVIPEPSTVLLAGLALAGFAARRR